MQAFMQQRAQMKAGKGGAAAAAGLGSAVAGPDRSADQQPHREPDPHGTWSRMSGTAWRLRSCKRRARHGGDR